MGGAIMAPPRFFHFQIYYRGMIHVISPIFHGESNGDNHLVVQQPDGDPEHHLDQQHGVGDQQWDDQKHVLVFDIKEIGFLWKNQMLRLQNDPP